MVASRLLSTADVPPQFLKSAHLVGRIPQKLAGSDPRVSYGLYIPQKHYNPDPSLSANGDQKSAPGRLPLLVAVHGAERAFSPVYDDLIPFADSTPCAVLAPLFPAGMDRPYDLASYMVLKSATLRSDKVLLDILDEIAQCWPGIETEKVFLRGYSGGGQFVHRFLYLYPERLAAVSIGAPGHATILDDKQDWPAGVANVDGIFGIPIRKDLIRQVPIHLAIGDLDADIPGGKEYWEWTKQVRARIEGEGGNAGGGRSYVGTELGAITQSRWETIHQLRDSWKQDGIEAQLDVVEGVAHDSRGVSACVSEFMQLWIQKGATRKQGEKKLVL